MNNRATHKKPLLVVSDGYGQVFEVPGLEMVGKRIKNRYLPEEEELIPMPSGSLLLELPGRKPVGYDRNRDKYVVLDNYEGLPVIAAAAFLAPAYTQLYRAAYVTGENAVTLPLFAYTPVGFQKLEAQAYYPTIITPPRKSPNRTFFTNFSKKSCELFILLL